MPATGHSDRSGIRAAAQLVGRVFRVPRGLRDDSGTPGHAAGTLSGVWATLIHTLGYFTVTAAVALLVYQKLGLAMLRRSWFKLDLIWAIALVVTGFVALLV
jgi:hypothetical protein